MSLKNVIQTVCENESEMRKGKMKSKFYIFNINADITLNKKNPICVAFLKIY